MTQRLGWVWVCVVLGFGCAGDIGGGQDDPDEESPPPPGDDIVPPEPNVELTPVSLTQSTGTPELDANVNCRYGETGPHADSRHYRALPMDQVVGGGQITEAILPIEVATSPEGSQSVLLRLHRLTGDLSAGEIDLLHEVAFDVPDQEIGEVRVPLAIDFAAGVQLVIEVSVPDGEELRNLRFGHNKEQQTGPTYLASESCGLALPTNLATLDNPFAEGETFGEHSWLVSLTVDPSPK